jgi:hypothetical protein
MAGAAIPLDQRLCVPGDLVGVRIIDSPTQPLWIICIRSTTLYSISPSRRAGESK